MNSKESPALGVRLLRVIHLTGFVGATLLQGCTALPPDRDSDARAATPVRAGGERTYSQVEAGFVHTCALDGEGSAYCWGSNDYNQLGSSDATESCGGRPCSRTPIAVSGGHTFTFLAAGWVHNCGIATDTRTYCWGGGAIGGQGYLGNGVVSTSQAPMKVFADSAFASVTIGDGHTCALTATGMAFCWGQNTWGQLGDATRSDRATPVAVATQERFRALSAGAYHTCGVTFANQAYCWGDNRWGQLGGGAVDYNSVGAIATKPLRVTGGLAFSAIAAGWEHTCGIATTGRIFCWGRNDDDHQLGDESNAANRGTPGPIAGELQFTTLTAGALATCGRTPTDETYCWGANYYGGLGNGEVVPAGVGRPVRTLGGPFVDVTLGQAHACAIASDKRLWCWGDQSAGQF